MRKRIIVGSVFVVVLGALALSGRILYLKFKDNPKASCANCRSFIHFALEEYAQQHGGWYPRGGIESLDSLAKCITNEVDTPVHIFTSHALRAKHAEYWRQHKSFSTSFCCYRYNEGLREDDPGDLILLYYFKPTRWECSSHKKSEIGRPVSFAPPQHSWEWMPEAEFQKRQQETLDYLKKHNRLAATNEAHNQASEPNVAPAP